MRPSFLECTGCGSRHAVRLVNVCDCGAPLFARYAWEGQRPEDLPRRKDLWRYAPLLPLEDSEIRSLGEGGTPLHRLRTIGSGGRVARMKVAALFMKDEGLNPTGTFKARGMAVAVPMAKALGARSLVVPTAGNAGAALAAYAAAQGVRGIVVLAADAPARAGADIEAFGADLLRVDGDISLAGHVANGLSPKIGGFSLATLREPYRVEGKKTILFEIWEALGGMPDWILFPTGGGTGIAGVWKGLRELRELGWYERPWPRLGVVQAEGCAPLVKAWREGREAAESWPNPETAAPGLRVPHPLADRIVLQAIRETRGAAVAVTEAAMAVAAKNLAVFEGIGACLEGAATLAGLRRLYDEGTIVPDDRVVLVNTGAAPGVRAGPTAGPVVRTTEEALAVLDVTPRASSLPRRPFDGPAAPSGPP